ncbi:MAG: hypothetical protein H7A37_05365 [Chlamydiales bacterium]|nr:hypothetical protein [Chlamydiia bacterium]MCP5507708.1 hypothetical protein [Chlamydiales bacterium]
MIRVFIGTESAQWLPTEVLKRSILARTDADVSFHELKDISLNLKLKMFTGFSFYRFCIPQECRFEGRAIYLDADMVVFDDIRNLAEMEMGGHGVLAKRYTDESYHTSNLLMDCSKLKHWNVREWVALINAGLLDYRRMMVAGSGTPIFEDFGILPDSWNNLDGFDEETKLIHYTNVPMQPWKRAGHPHADLFLREMRATLDDGIITEEEIQREIASKHIYPEILQDMHKATVG